MAGCRYKTVSDFTQEQKQNIIDSFNSGSTINQLREYYSTGRRNIENILKEAGYNNFNRFKGERLLESIDFEAIKSLRDDGLTISEIAINLNTTNVIIRNIFKKYNESIERPLMRSKNRFKYDLDIKWVAKFKEYDKFKYLCRKHSNYWNHNKEQFMQYIEKFYNDERFNKIYSIWQSTKNPLLKPSIDHIDAVSTSNNSSIDNLQCLTWFANRAKNNMSKEQWQHVCENLNLYFM